MSETPNVSKRPKWLIVWKWPPGYTGPVAPTVVYGDLK